MNDVVIRADKLGKLYRIGSRERYKTLRDVLSNPFRRRQTTDETIWALRDVSFEIKQGEVVGIIGRNGAGKSTLLKILSRITEPTEGYADIIGRVGSLLEVGTGFHPELTGRENIYLNGSILGMHRAEITKQFDAIVAFAEVEKFIDTPVKHYSSGMQMRLAFSVAAHLEPEILLVDEVLAVGDAEFQNKCLGKIGEVASSGRTILFVSHNLTAISNLCHNVIYLSDGRLTSKSATSNGVLAYTRDLGSPAAPLAAVRRGPVTVHNFRICQCAAVLDEYDSGEAIEVLIEFELHETMDRFRLGFFLKTTTGEVIARVLLADWEPQHAQLVRGRYQARGYIPAHTLVDGHYLVQVHGSRYGIEDYRLDEAFSHRILVRADGGYNQAHLGERPFGCVLINPHWELTRT